MTDLDPRIAELDALFAKCGDFPYLLNADRFRIALDEAWNGGWLREAAIRGLEFEACRHGLAAAVTQASTLHLDHRGPSAGRLGDLRGTFDPKTAVPITRQKGKK